MYSNFGMDPTLFYQFLNVARTNRETMRPWRRLTKVDTSNLVNGSNTWKTPLTIPSDFVYLTEDGLITLFDGVDTYQDVDEVPFNLTPQYKDYSNKFAMDHANGKFYILGVVSQAFNVWMYYQADYGDITAATTWINIPSRFHMMLAFDALNMYELGVDYDDLQARNATKLGQMAESLYSAMVQWDDRLQRSMTTRVDYPEDMGAPFRSNQISNFQR